MITPVHPSTEVRRQERHWKAYDRMPKGQASAVIRWWVLLTFFLTMSGLAVFALPHRDPITAPITCYQRGC